MRHQVIERSRVNDHTFPTEGEGEAIQAPGSRAIQVFAGHMIVRTVTGTLKTRAIIAKWDRTPQVNTLLIQPDPVRTIAILDNGFRGELVLKRCPLQRELRLFTQVRYVGFGRLDVKHACLANLEITRLCRRKIRLCADGYQRAELTGQVGVEHEERTAHACGGGQPPYCQHRATQEAPPRQPLLRDFGSFRSSAM